MVFSTFPHLIAYPHDLGIKLAVTPENTLADLNLQILCSLKIDLQVAILSRNLC